MVHEENMQVCRQHDAAVPHTALWRPKQWKAASRLVVAVQRVVGRRQTLESDGNHFLDTVDLALHPDVRDALCAATVVFAVADSGGGGGDGDVAQQDKEPADEILRRVGKRIMHTVEGEMTPVEAKLIRLLGKSLQLAESQAVTLQDYVSRVERIAAICTVDAAGLLEKGGTTTVTRRASDVGDATTNEAHLMPLNKKHRVDAAAHTLSEAADAAATTSVSSNTVNQRNLTKPTLMMIDDEGVSAPQKQPPAQFTNHQHHASSARGGAAVTASVVASSSILPPKVPLTAAALAAAAATHTVACNPRPCDVCDDASGDLASCRQCLAWLHEACGGPHCDDPLAVCRTCRRALGFGSDQSEINSMSSSDEHVSEDSADTSLSGFIVRDEDMEDEISNYSFSSSSKSSSSSSSSSSTPSDVIRSPMVSSSSKPDKKPHRRQQQVSLKMARKSSGRKPRNDAKKVSPQPKRQSIVETVMAAAAKKAGTKSSVLSTAADISPDLGPLIHSSVSHAEGERKDTGGRGRRAPARPTKMGRPCKLAEGGSQSAGRKSGKRKRNDA